MRHLISTKVKVILILAVLLAAGLTIFSGVSNQNIFSNVTQSVLTPLRSGVNSMAEQAEKYYGYMFAYESLVAENAELKSQLAGSQSDQSQSWYDLTAAQAEVARLEEENHASFYQIRLHCGADAAASFVPCRMHKRGQAGGVCRYADCAAV